MPKAQGVPHPDFLPVVQAFARKRGVTAGVMMSSYGLKADGKIFAMHVGGRLVVKLPKTRVDEMVEDGVGVRFDPGHGRVMKEWIAVSPGSEHWVDLAKEAYEFVRSAAARR